jgi:membrane fusion protein (multidrug efflux system)
MRVPHILRSTAALTIISVLSACGKPPGGPPPAPGTPVVGVMTVRMQPVVLDTELPGRTVPYLIADVRPQVNGIIKQRNFNEGSDVKAGQVLYQINPASYKASYDSSVAALAKAEASVRTARLKAARYKDLVLIKAVSQQDYDDAVAALGEAEADVGSARANVETSRINLDYAKVDAPISGRIGKSTVTQGALVTASQSTALTTIQQLDPIYVDVTQSSTTLLNLKDALANGDLQKSGSGAKVKLILENGRPYAQEGTLQFSDVTVNQDTGAITLRAVFPNPRADLLPGMYVRAVLQEGVKQHGLLVPQQAVSRDGAGKPQVFVVNADAVLEQRAIVTERAIGDQWLISSGLKDGDQLVIDGQQRAAAGVKVKVVPWPSKSDTTATKASSTVSVN